jgi:acetyl-CoA C-acetyltransferase
MPCFPSCAVLAPSATIAAATRRKSIANLRPVGEHSGALVEKFGLQGQQLGEVGDGLRCQAFQRLGNLGRDATLVRRACHAAAGIQPAAPCGTSLDTV